MVCANVLVCTESLGRDSRFHEFVRILAISELVALVGLVFGIVIAASRHTSLVAGALYGLIPAVFPLVYFVLKTAYTRGRRLCCPYNHGETYDTIVFEGVVSQTPGFVTQIPESR